MPDQPRPQSDERLDDLDAAVHHNRRVAQKVIVLYAAALSTALAVAFGLVVALSGGPFVGGVVVGVVVGVAATLAIRSAGARWVLAGVEAEPGSGPEIARVRNLVSALAVAAGVPRPQVRLIDDPGPNAMTVGRGPAPATLVVTRGLVEELDRLQLEGVIAHELGHIRRGDTEVTTLAASLVGWPLLAAERAATGPSWARPLSPLLMASGPLVVWGLRRVVGWRREHLADLTAIRFTRYPPALISALGTIAGTPPGPSAAPLVTFPMWLVAPPGDQNARRAGLARRIQTHPSIDERVEALAEL